MTALSSLFSLYSVISSLNKITDNHHRKIVFFIYCDLICENKKNLKNPLTKNFLWNLRATKIKEIKKYICVIVFSQIKNCNNFRSKKDVKKRCQVQVFVDIAYKLFKQVKEIFCLSFLSLFAYEC